MAARARAAALQAPPDASTTCTVSVALREVMSSVEELMQAARLRLAAMRVSLGRSF